MIKDMTSGKPYAQIISFAAPLILGNLFQQFYQITDSALVGRYIGKQGLSAIGSTGSLSSFFLNLILGLCMGLSIPVSQCFGAGDGQGMRRLIANGMLITLGTAALTAVITVPAAWGMLSMIDTPGDTIADAAAYVRVIFAGIIVFALFNVTAGILRAVGSSRIILLSLIFSALLNIALDLLFIRVFSAGVAGAAAATVISQLCSALILLAYIKIRLPEIIPRRSDFVPEIRQIKRLVSFGVPMGLQFSITSVGIILMQWSINMLGSDAVTAYSVASKVMAVITQQMDTLGIAMATYCGQNLGAGRVSRVSGGVARAAVIMAIIGVAGFILLNLFGKSAALLFIDRAEADIIIKIAEFTFYQTMFFPFLCAVFLYRYSLQGLGFGIHAMFAGVCELIGRGVTSVWLILDEKAFIAANGALTPGYIDRGFRLASLISPVAWAAAGIFLAVCYFYYIRLLKLKFPENIAV